LFRGDEKEYVIAKATDEDVKVCADLISKALGGQSIDKQGLEQTLKTSGIIVLVAKLKDKVVGLITGLAFPSMIPPPRIDFLGVSDEESARKGVHSRLIDKFIEELDTRVPNAKYVDTTVSASNPQFVAMYSMKGFVVTGFIKGDQMQNDSVLLRKSIVKEKPTSYTV
jgi:ribosomal protein S18 acetylase RimI-like enzyme